MTMRILFALGVMLEPLPKTLLKNLMTSPLLPAEVMATLLVLLNTLLQRTLLTLLPTTRMTKIQITKRRTLPTRTILSACTHRRIPLTMIFMRLILLVLNPDMCLKHSIFVLDLDDIED